MKSVKIFLYLLLAAVVFSCSTEKKEPPCTIVLFGATGDLTSRKLLPALSNLAVDGSLPEKYAIVGVGRKDYSHADFRNHSLTQMGLDSDFQNRIFYAQVDFEENRGYEHLTELLLEIDRGFGAKANRIYFLATKDRFFAPIVEQLSARGLISDPTKSKEWSRVMVEKPFGHDLQSATELQQSLSQTLDESQIYRIDHYLGKEGVQKMLAFRLKGEFEPLWNNRHIDHVQITVSEEIGIGTRGQFWEETGLLRDVFQNHIMQILALATVDLTTDDIAAEKTHLFEAFRPIAPSEIVRGQYGPGKNAAGYRQEKSVPESSFVETFVAAKLWIDNERWEGVPFYVRAGKRLPKQLAEVAVRFKNNPDPLVIRIQPNPGIFFQGQELLHTEKVVPEAYETLLLECLQGDKTHFVQKEEALAAWRLFTPVIRQWNEHPPIEPFPNYEAGTWGPDLSSQLLNEDGREWLDPVF